jgi:hypothetical protein
MPRPPQSLWWTRFQCGNLNPEFEHATKILSYFLLETTTKLIRILHYIRGWRRYILTPNAAVRCLERVVLGHRWQIMVSVWIEYLSSNVFKSTLYNLCLQPHFRQLTLKHINSCNISFCMCVWYECRVINPLPQVFYLNYFPDSDRIQGETLCKQTKRRLIKSYSVQRWCFVNCHYWKVICLCGRPAGDIAL